MSIYGLVIFICSSNNKSLFLITLCFFPSLSQLRYPQCGHQAVFKFPFVSMTVEETGVVVRGRGWWLAGRGLIFRRKFREKINSSIS